MKELFSRLLSRPGITVEILVVSLFANVLALASPLFVMQVLNRYVTFGVDATLATLSAGVVLAILFEFAFRQVRLRLGGALSAEPDETLALGAFDVLSGAKAAAMDLLPPGLRREVIQGTDYVQGAYAPANIAALVDFPFAFLFLGALYLLSPLLAGIALGFQAFVFVVGLISFLALRGASRELTTVSSRRAAHVDTGIAASDAIRAFNSADFVRGLWSDDLFSLLSLRDRIALRQGFVQSLTQSAQVLMGAVVIATGAMQVVSGTLDVGVLIGANILAGRALGAVSRLAQLGEAFSRARQSLRMFQEFERLPREKEEGAAPAAYKGALELRDVAFAFPGSTVPLFESLALKVAPGEAVTVTGGNGTGKTTLARLILQLLEPNRGQILADGVNLGQVRLDWWRRQILYLPQEPHFINATIRENLLAFNPDLTDKDLARLVEKAGLRKFLDQSPNGLDTRITNNGATLSLGIRRRIALARALASTGRLAIFDDPTDGLDKEGRDIVMRVIEELTKTGRTILLFTHDPYVVRGGRQILDLNSKPVPRLLDVQAGGAQ